MRTPEARAAYYEQCWGIAAAAGNEAREAIKEAHALLQDIANLDGLFEGEATDFYKAQSLAEQALDKLLPFVTSLPTPKPETDNA